MTKPEEQEIRSLQRYGEEEQPIKGRSHPAIADLGRTNSKNKTVMGIELRESLYKPQKKQGFILTGQTRISFEGESIKISAKTDRTLTALISLIPEDKYYSPNEVVRVETTVKDLQNLYGLKDAKAARKGIDEDLASLASITIQREDAKGDLKIGVPVVGDAWGRYGSKVIFPFSPTFMALLKSGESFPTYYPPELYKVDMQKNTHAWTIGKKLIHQTYANLGKPNETLLSVKALLNYTESIPSEEEVKNTDRAYTHRIIAPLERDLNALVSDGILLYWDYCHSKGEPLTDEEQAARLNDKGEEQPLDYYIAKTLLITWKLVHEYDREEIIEARNISHIKKLASHKQAEQEKAKREERRKREEDKRIGAARAEDMLKKEEEG